MKIRSTSFASLALAAVAAGPTLTSAQVFTHNGGATPTCCAWNPDGVGWSYTPTVSYMLTMIETRFQLDGYPYSPHNVTAEIRASDNGAVLGSATFGTSPSGADWVGGSFAPVALIGGTSYFIDFTGLLFDGTGYVGPNAVLAAPSGEFGAFEFASNAGDSFTLDSEDFDPIVRLTGTGATTSTPEPASIALVGTGLAGLIGVARRRRSAARES